METVGLVERPLGGDAVEEEGVERHAVLLRRRHRDGFDPGQTLGRRQGEAD